MHCTVVNFPEIYHFGKISGNIISNKSLEVMTPIISLESLDSWYSLEPC